MIKLSKKKILVCLVVAVLLASVFGSVSSLASSTNTLIVGNPTSTADDNTAGAVNNTNSNGSVPATVGATGNNESGNNALGNSNGANTNINSVGNTNNSSSYSANNSVANRSSLPYAGTNSSVMFIVIVLTVSALYAYKKVSDYNV